MARPLRIEYRGAYYHVMNRGQYRRNIFVDDKGRQTFLDLLADMARLWKVEIYAYCLMGNHYHLLLSVPTGVLSRPMRHLDGIYTQKFNRVHHRDGPLFRGRYKAILIDAEEYFLSVVRYIHKNPLGAGRVSDIDRYRWSSHWGYLNKKECPHWLDTRSVLSRLGGLKEYQRFMDEEIVEATAWGYGKAVEELKWRKRGAQNEARMVAIYLGRELGGHKHEEIGKTVGLGKRHR